MGLHWTQKFKSSINQLKLKIKKKKKSTAPPQSTHLEN